MVSRTAAAVALAVILGLAGIASAQALARLTVTSFDLASDTASPKIDVPFHLIVTLRVREHVAEIENLDLPMLAQLELLGDERETVTGPRGAEYRETITVVAHTAGTMSVAPATLQAIDARDGKAKQWYTNGLTLHVIGNAGTAVGIVARDVLWTLLAILALLCLLGVVLVWARRRPLATPQIIPASPPPAPTVIPLVRSVREQVQDALTALRADRTRPTAVVVRAAVWRMVGATDGETLGDVLRRNDSMLPLTRDLLIALERSAFTREDDLQAAIGDACAALERYVESIE